MKFVLTLNKIIGFGRATLNALFCKIPNFSKLYLSASLEMCAFRYVNAQYQNRNPSIMLLQFILSEKIIENLDQEILSENTFRYTYNGNEIMSKIISHVLYA